MARGTTKVQQAAQAQQEARARAQQNALPQIFTSSVDPSKGNGPVLARFLEQGEDINTYDRHEYSVPDGKGGFYRRQFTCLRESPWNQPECPGCAAGLKIKLRGVYNVIWRNRAVYRKGADGKVIKVNGQPIIDGYADEVCILDVPSTTAEVLRGKDGSYHGLGTRDVILSASGNSFQPWNIEPADIGAPPTPLSENDMALYARKHDLDKFMEPPSFQEAAQIIAQYGANSGARQQAPMSPTQPVSPQGNGMQAQPANGFLAGAAVPGQGSAFGAAQAAVQPQPPVPQQQAPAPPPQSPYPPPVQPPAPPVMQPPQPLAPPVPQPQPTPAPAPVQTPQQ